MTMVYVNAGQEQAAVAYLARIAKELGDDDFVGEEYRWVLFWNGPMSRPQRNVLGIVVSQALDAGGEDIDDYLAFKDRYLKRQQIAKDRKKAKLETEDELGPVQEKDVVIAVMLDTSVSETDKRILAALFKNVFHRYKDVVTDRWAVSLSKIAQDAHVHLATVNRRLPKLEADGWFDRLPDRGGWHHPTVFVGLWAKAFNRYANLASHSSATVDPALASHNCATREQNLASHSCATTSSTTLESLHDSGHYSGADDRLRRSRVTIDAIALPKRRSRVHLDPGKEEGLPCDPAAGGAPARKPRTHLYEEELPMKRSPRSAPVKEPVSEPAPETDEQFRERIRAESREYAREHPVKEMTDEEIERFNNRRQRIGWQ